MLLHSAVETFRHSPSWTMSHELAQDHIDGMDLDNTVGDPIVDQSTVVFDYGKEVLDSMKLVAQQPFHRQTYLHVATCRSRMTASQHMTHVVVDFGQIVDQCGPYSSPVHSCVD